MIKNSIIVFQSILIIIIISTIYIKYISNTKVWSGYNYSTNVRNNNNQKDVYKGFLKNNELNGYGEHYIDSEQVYKYCGEFKNGLYNGLGAIYISDELKFVGEFKNGKKNGSGIEFVENKIFSIGDYVDDEKMGFVRIIGHYEGYFKNGYKNGKGISYIENDYGNIFVVYDGEYKDNERDGYGTFLWDNNIIYKGSFEKGKMKGKGILYYNDTFPPKIKYKGHFENSKFNGFGILYNNNGSIIHKGIFKDGKYIEKEN